MISVSTTLPQTFWRAVSLHRSVEPWPDLEHRVAELMDHAAEAVLVKWGPVPACICVLTGMSNPTPPVDRSLDPAPANLPEVEEWGSRVSRIGNGRTPCTIRLCTQPLGQVSSQFSSALLSLFLGNDLRLAIAFFLQRSAE